MQRGSCHAHLVEHHDDVAGRHEHLLLDFLPLEGLDPQRLVLDAAAGAGAGDHRDLFLDRQLRLEFDSDHALGAAAGGLHHGDGDEPLLHHRDLCCSGRRRHERDPGGVGHLAGSLHDHLGPRDRFAAGPYLHPDPFRLLCGRDDGKRRHSGRSAVRPTATASAPKRLAGSALRPIPPAP